MDFFIYFISEVPFDPEIGTTFIYKHQRSTIFDSIIFLKTDQTGLHLLIKRYLQERYPAKSG